MYDVVVDQFLLPFIDFAPDSNICTIVPRPASPGVFNAKKKKKKKTQKTPKKKPKTQKNRVIPVLKTEITPQSQKREGGIN